MIKPSCRSVSSLAVMDSGDERSMMSVLRNDDIFWMGLVSFAFVGWSSVVGDSLGVRSGLLASELSSSLSEFGDSAFLWARIRGSTLVQGTGVGDVLLRGVDVAL